MPGCPPGEGSESNKIEKYLKRNYQINIDSLEESFIFFCVVYLRQRNVLRVTRDKNIMLYYIK